MSDTTTTTLTQTYQEMVDALLAKLPKEHREAAAALIAIYGPKLLEIAAADAYAYIQRLLANDVTVAQEILEQCSDAELLAQVAANTALWADQETFNAYRKEMMKSFVLTAAPLLLKILLAMVGVCL